MKSADRQRERFAQVVVFAMWLLAPGCGGGQMERNDYEANKREAELQNRSCRRDCDEKRETEIPRGWHSDPRPNRRAETCRLRCANELTEARHAVRNPDGQPSEDYLERRDRERGCKLECSQARDRHDARCDASLGADTFSSCLERSDSSLERCTKGCDEDREAGRASSDDVSAEMAPAPRASRTPAPALPGSSPNPNAGSSDVARKQCVDENTGWPVFVYENVPGLPFHGLTSPHPESRSWTIQFRPDAASFPVSVQRFLFAHECGHVNTALAQPAEINANCWAARRLTQLRAMTSRDWEEVHQILVMAFPQPTGPYPSGEQQFSMIMQCVAN